MPFEGPWGGGGPFIHRRPRHGWRWGSGGGTGPGCSRPPRRAHTRSRRGSGTTWPRHRCSRIAGRAPPAPRRSGLGAPPLGIGPEVGIWARLSGTTGGTRGPPDWTMTWIGTTVAWSPGFFTAAIRSRRTSAASLNASFGSLGPSTPQVHRYCSPPASYTSWPMMSQLLDMAGHGVVDGLIPLRSSPTPLRGHHPTPRPAIRCPTAHQGPAVRLRHQLPSPTPD